MLANEQPALGEHLRRERTERGLSLRELARRLEVSASLVSQIETGKIQPSVRTLYAIVSELNLSMDEMFNSTEREIQERPAENGLSTPSTAHASDSDDDLGYVQRGGTRRSLDLESGVHWERLTVRNEPGVEFLYSTYPPGSESAPAGALVRHGGREFGIVLKGRLGVTIGFSDYLLEAGDSTFFDSTTPHRLYNDGDETVEAIWIVLDRQAERPSSAG
jgi:transcriptional regulator with XRE-family HTH domain